MGCCTASGSDDWSNRLKRSNRQGGGMTIRPGLQRWRVPSGGFTLIELLVVMAILGALLSIAAPRYFDSLNRAKEATLRTDLRLLRESIDKYRADTGRLPTDLPQLAQARYLRSVPVDPITETDTSWVVVPDPNSQATGVYDVRSGADGYGRDGTLYASW
jgi:general secretion pathway protein G